MSSKVSACCVAIARWHLIDVTIQPNANPSEHGEEAIKEINADFGIPASFYRVDVRDQVAVEEAINGIVRDFGGLDVLLCSAGKLRNNSPSHSSTFREM
jgi:NAD(P)-dependent dehydrogenase (short-subunit alcohol dehydrogenase family)